jgi:hypothetical protein
MKTTLVAVVCKNGKCLIGRVTNFFGCPTKYCGGSSQWVKVGGSPGGLPEGNIGEINYDRVKKSLEYFYDRAKIITEILRNKKNNHGDLIKK